MAKIFCFIPFIVRFALASFLFISVLSCRDQNSIKWFRNMNKNDTQNSQNFQIEDISPFVISAAAFNREVIQLSQLAQQKGITHNVKKMGARMEKEHSIILKELQQLAESRSIIISNDFSYDAKDNYQKFTDKLPEYFDKAYCDWIIESQQATIVLYDDASKYSSDQEIKVWAKGMLPILGKQLVYAIDCQQ